MNQIFTVAILGCGGRGADTYGNLMAGMPDCYRITALCDCNPERLSSVREHFGIAPENCFLDETRFFEKKRADLLVVATQDADHVRHCTKGLALSYDILLEKPITGKREECAALLAAQKASGRKVFVCHVLRYAPAFVKAAELLDSGAIGRLVAIDATEQVMYWHQAHSYVRGNWRRSDETTPMILAKCCHDLDLLQFYAKSKCKSLSSVGDLTYFTPDNAPEGATARCLNCPHIDTCPYSAKSIYLDRFLETGQKWPTSAITLKRPLNEEVILQALREGPYGRCVFHCDNNVVDHQLTVMTFENGVKATLTMTGFTARGGRIMCFRGTLGELLLNEGDGILRLHLFRHAPEEWKISDLVTAGVGHGGGDDGIVRALYRMLSGAEEGRTTLEASIESHLMGIAAEESRLQGGALVEVHG